MKEKSAYQSSLAYAMLALTAVILATGHQWRYRESLPQSPFERDTARLLEARGEPNALLLAEPYSYALQARTGHPILAEAATPSLISYLPRLAPGIDKLYSELYGIRFGLGETSAPSWKPSGKNAPPRNGPASARTTDSTTSSPPAACQSACPRCSIPRTVSSTKSQARNDPPRSDQAPCPKNVRIRPMTSSSASSRI